MLKAIRLHQQYKNLLLINRWMFAKTPFKKTPEWFNFPEEEETILKFWNQNKCFEQQLNRTKNLPKFTFYDGPPFATGTPHYGHIAAGTIKDVVCRYATQTGHFVSRRFGWDCHGLPVEHEINKQFDIKGKQEVLDMGIAQYNRRCRSIVMKYSKEWEQIIGRFGRWIDFKNDYKTLDLSFMESVWYVFKVLFDKGLVYRGRKVMPYSNGITTVLSNFEVQLNYKEVDDPSLFVNFPMVKDPKVKFLVWTTTPWTLPSNLALAVNPNMDYVKVKDLKSEEVYIMAECRLNEFFRADKKKEKLFEVLEKMKGSELEGIEYIPIFNYFEERVKDGCFRVQVADFVTSDAGTGVVHCAPGFGDDDYKMCVRKKIINPDDPPVPVDQEGRFTAVVKDYVGVLVKDADKPIIRDLKAKGRVVKSESMKHNYPYCWRTETPLIYKAVSTWFIRVTEIKDDLVKNNAKASWVPKNIQEGRFDNWLKDAQDWCFSRNRFWGNPIPLWVSDDGEEIVCVGSIQELKDLTGVKEVTDLHRESIDHLTIESKQGKGKLRRIEEVFDCWFESGSMPYAQVHYPFSMSEEEFSKIYPADFIGEGIDQTRGWFYTLNVIATGIKNMNPYKNLIVNGTVLNEKGEKMSKSKKNYPDPMLVVNQHGADAIRLALINSPVVKAGDMKFSSEGVRSTLKDIFLPWYNAYRFLIQNISKLEHFTQETFVFNQNVETLSGQFTVLDRWILSSLQVLIGSVRQEMNSYKLYAVVPQLVRFLELLTNWYVRLNRNRIKGDIGEDAMKVGLNALFDVLLKTNILMSPLVPFLTENMYQNMRLSIKQGSPLKEQSIHYLSIPEAQQDAGFDVHIELLTAMMREIIEVGRKLRETQKISLKQPIISLTIVNKDQALFKDLKPFMKYIEDELNVAQIKSQHDIYRYIKLQALPNLPVLGPKFKGDKSFGDLKKAIAVLTTEQLLKCQAEGTITINGKTLDKSDLLIKEKFKKDLLQDHEIIGGEKVIVLLDTRQNEELKIRGFAREIINRVQKLKKKAKLNPQDPFLIFYRLGEKAEYLTLALDKERQMVDNAVKKPLIGFNYSKQRVSLGKDQGYIDEEEYEIVITNPGPVFDSTKLKEDFGDSSDTLVSMVLSLPANKMNHKEHFKFVLDGKECVLQKGKHYKYLL